MYPLGTLSLGTPPGPNTIARQGHLESCARSPSPQPCCRALGALLPPSATFPPPSPPCYLAAEQRPPRTDTTTSHARHPPCATELPRCIHPFSSAPCHRAHHSWPLLPHPLVLASPSSRCWPSHRPVVSTTGHAESPDRHHPIGAAASSPSPLSRPGYHLASHHPHPRCLPNNHGPRAPLSSPISTPPAPQSSQSTTPLLSSPPPHAVQALWDASAEAPSPFPNVARPSLPTAGLPRSAFSLSARRDPVRLSFPSLPAPVLVLARHDNAEPDCIAHQAISTMGHLGLGPTC
jgi:hypothetical protein